MVPRRLGIKTAGVAGAGAALACVVDTAGMFEGSSILGAPVNSSDSTF